MALEVTAANFDQEVRHATLPVIVDAYAPWCGPCRLMVPVFEELSKELGKSYKFVKMNIDEARDMAIEFQIMSVPTFLFLKEGKVVGRELGTMTKERFKERIAAILG